MAVAAVEQGIDDLLDAIDLGFADNAAAAVVHRLKHQPLLWQRLTRRRQAGLAPADRVDGVGRVGLEPAVIEELRHHRRERGLHPPAGGQEHAPIGWHHVGALHQVLQAGAPGVAGMIGLGGLGQLLLIAHQQDGFGAASHHQQVGQRHLACLIDHQQVELISQLLSAEHPGRPAHHRHAHL